MLAVNEAKCSATEASLGLPDFLICLKNPGLATSGTDNWYHKGLHGATIRRNGKEKVKGRERKKQREREERGRNAAS